MIPYYVRLMFVPSRPPQWWCSFSLLLNHRAKLTSGADYYVPELWVSNQKLVSMLSAILRGMFLVVVNYRVGAATNYENQPTWGHAVITAHGDLLLVLPHK